MTSQERHLCLVCTKQSTAAGALDHHLFHLQGSTQNDSTLISRPVNVPPAKGTAWVWLRVQILRQALMLGDWVGSSLNTGVLKSRILLARACQRDGKWKDLTCCCYFGDDRILSQDISSTWKLETAGNKSQQSRAAPP